LVRRGPAGLQAAGGSPDPGAKSSPAFGRQANFAARRTIR
jgi:hypothetical protein